VLEVWGEQDLGHVADLRPGRKAAWEEWWF
jgi:hypothetical protein